MQITTQEDGNIYTAKIHGKVNSESVERIEEFLRQQRDLPSHHLILDCTELDYISSAGLRSMLLTSKSFQPTNWEFALCSLQDHVLEIFEMAGFDSFITIRESREQLLQLLRGEA